MDGNSTGVIYIRTRSSGVNCLKRRKHGLDFTSCYNFAKGQAVDGKKIFAVFRQSLPLPKVNDIRKQKLIFNFILRPYTLYIIQWLRRGNLLAANKRMKSLYPETEFFDVIGIKS